jgi:hypothetical protein
VSNTPQQALTLLNDPTFVEAARAFRWPACSPMRARPATTSASAAPTSSPWRATAEGEAETASLLKFLATQRDSLPRRARDAEKLLQGRPRADAALEECPRARWNSRRGPPRPRFAQRPRNHHALLTAFAAMKTTSIPQPTR